MIEESWLVEYVEQAKKFGAVTAIDIGANVGEFTRLLASHFDNVIAVEPDPRALEILRSSVPKNVMCQHAAISSKNGAVDFHLRPNTVQSSLLLEHPIGAGDQADAPVIETIGVNAMTLDFLLFAAKQRFGDLGTLFIKVDVEGAEGAVLAGATDDSFRRSAWLIEVHDRQEQVERGLESLGYDEITVIEHPLPAAHPKHLWIYAEPQ